MPVYLVHGFRWPREGFTGIRVHAVVHNLDDCSAEYIQNENSREEILRSFRQAFPDIMRELEGPVPLPGTSSSGGSSSGGATGMAAAGAGRRIEFIEQYDPDDVEGPYAVSQPYAFVGDKVVVIAAGPNSPSSTIGVAQSASFGRPESPNLPTKKSRAPTLPMSKSLPFNSPADTGALSINVEEVIAEGPGLTTKAWEALADLRDKIAEGEKIGWWVVYNGDPERAVDDLDEEEGHEQTEDVGAEGEEMESKNQQRALTSPPAAPFRTPVAAQTPQKSPQPGLTALPVHPTAPATRSDKNKGKQVPADPSQLKEQAKSQGLRKKFFGRRS